MANLFYNIDTSSFKPFTFQDIIRPLVMQKENEDKFELQLDEQEKQAALLQMLSESDLDQNEYNTYQNYLNKLRSVSDQFATSGLAGGVNNKFRELKSIYNTSIAPIAARYQLREAQKAQEQTLYDKDPSIIFAKPAANRKLGDYANGVPQSKHISGNALRDEAAKFALSYSQTYDTPIVDKNTLNQYFIVTESGGINKDTMLQIYNSNNVIKNYTDNMLKQIGATSYSSEDQFNIMSYIINGLLLGATQAQRTQYLRNLSYSASALGGKGSTGKRNPNELITDHGNGSNENDYKYGGKINKFDEGGDTDDEPSWEDSLSVYRQQAKKAIGIKDIENSGNEIYTWSKFFNRIGDYGVNYNESNRNAFIDQYVKADDKGKSRIEAQVLKDVSKSLSQMGFSDIEAEEKLNITNMLRGAQQGSGILARAREGYSQQKLNIAKQKWQQQHWNNNTQYTNQNNQQEEKEFNQEDLNPWSRDNIIKNLDTKFKEKGINLNKRTLAMYADRIISARNQRDIALQQGYTDPTTTYGVDYKGLGYQDFTSTKGNRAGKVIETPYSSNLGGQDIYEEYRTQKEKEDVAAVNNYLIGLGLDAYDVTSNVYENINTPDARVVNEGESGDNTALVVNYPYNWETIEPFTVEGKNYPIEGYGIPEDSDFNVATYNSSGIARTPQEIADVLDDQIYDVLVNATTKSFNKSPSPLSPWQVSNYDSPAIVLDSPYANERTSKIKKIFEDYAEIVPKYIDRYNLQRNIVGRGMKYGDWVNFLNKFNEGIRSNKFDNLDIFPVGKDRGMLTVRFTQQDFLSNTNSENYIKTALQNAVSNGSAQLVSGKNIRPKFNKDYKMEGVPVNGKFNGIPLDDITINMLDYEPQTGTCLVSVQLKNTPAVTSFTTQQKDEGRNDSNSYIIKIPVSSIGGANNSTFTKNIRDYTTQYREAISDYNGLKTFQGLAGLVGAFRDKLELKYTNTQTLKSGTVVGYSQDLTKPALGLVDLQKSNIIPTFSNESNENIVTEEE